MFQNKLLILRRTLIKLLKKSFIQVSNSLIATSMLFVQKLEKNLRFCVNYRDLNKLIKKNRYLLSLIYETLRNINKAK